MRPATDTPNVEPTAPPPDTVDPDEPLAPLPGLDVEWPEFSDEGDDSDIVVEADGTIDYDWTITGLPAEVDSQIEAAFKLASALEAGDGDALNSTQIDLRARTDVTLLDTILRSEGYYGATIEPIISAADDARSILVTMEVDSGPRYVFIDVNLPGIDAAGEVEADLRDAYGIEAGDPVVAADVVAAEVELRSKLGEEGFAQAEIGERTVVVDHKERTASLTLPVDPGPVASFGNIIVEGQPPFPPDHVQTLARFDRGDTFKRSLVEDLRRALVATGLVTAATVDPEPSEDGETVDLRIVLTPAPPRTIAGNVGYSTGEGFRAEASWEHRNLINPEGAFQARAVLGTQEQLGSVGLRFNNWKVRDQSLSFSALVGAIDRPAYEANTVILT
ncbi:MAG: outer membrane protein assembly factor, partial [Sphingomonadaceae bacterium]